MTTEDALARRDWDGYLLLRSSHEGLRAFLDLLDEVGRALLDDRDYWRLLGQVWIAHDVVRRDLATWRLLFGSPRPFRGCLMDEAERAHLAALPDLVTVHRGFNHPHGRPGLAWTLDATKAEWFARRFDWTAGASVASVTIPRARIVAVFDSRGEDEAIVPDLRGYPPISTALPLVSAP